jgi:membrane fusion protein, heavy metal efflux system
MKAIAVGAALVAAILVAGCHAHEVDATTTAPQKGAAPPQPPTGVVELPPESLMHIKVDQTRGTDAPQALTATGKVQFAEDRIARILPPVSGQVQQLRVQVGDAVHAGEVLFMLNSRDVAAAFAEHISAHRDLDLAQKTFAMTQDLFDHQAASRISLQQAENDVAKQTARLQQDEQVLRVLGVDMPESADESAIAPRVPVRTPINGVVTERAVTDGQFVDTQAQPLLTVADLSTVWVLADVFERNLREISLGQRAEVTTTAYPDERFTARIAQIGNVVDPETHTVSVRFLVTNLNGRLKPGMFATASLYLPQGSNALTVPATAVFMEDGKSYSYVQTSDRTFVRRRISTAPDSGNRVRVMAGLRPGDRIVTDGVLLLRQEEAQGASTSLGASHQ